LTPFELTADEFISDDAIAPPFGLRCSAAVSSAAIFSAATLCGGQLRLQQMSSRSHKLPVDLKLAGVSGSTSRSA
jgi:hypothetical protein